MARRSKRRAQLKGQPQRKQKREKLYKAGIYARLSVDHHDGKETSIETQIEIGREYLKAHGEILLYDCYSDLGATGTDFERSDFERLMQDIRDGLVNCVIVKDFSRFGRNYIETGNYVEKLFPFMGVRFIAVTDRYDSVKQIDGNEALSMRLKNIANELYARDIAEKVTASKRKRMEQGEYLGSIPPYGYVIERINGKRTLVREPAAGEIVKQIFERYDSGETLAALVRWLYEQKIHRPTEYRNYKTVYQQDGQRLVQWDRSSVRRILTGSVYTGKRIKGDSKRQGCGQLRKDTGEDILQGILYCGECGHRLSRTATERKGSYQEMTTVVFYGCPNTRRIDEGKCENEQITFFQLQNIILQTLKKEFAFSTAQAERLTAFNKAEWERQKEQIRKKQKELQKSAEGIKVKISACYLEYRRGKSSQTQFLEAKKSLEEKRERRLQVLQELDNKYSLIDRQAEVQNQFIRAVLKCRGCAELKAELVQRLIEKIYVYSGKRAEIIWKWRDEIAEVLKGAGDEG